MDDMNAFERQVARDAARDVGPVRPVDDLAIFNAITTTQSPKWRFQSMFGATKFVVAGVIVALFGGFLLSGVLTQPSDESAPAVGASASASLESEPANEATTAPETSTTPDLLPGVALVTEEVEPGVFRVVSDGVRDLARPLPDYNYAGSYMTLVAGLDGSVWLHPGRLFKGDRPRPTYPGHELPFRLGHPVDARIGDERNAEGALNDYPSQYGDITVGPDGTLWMVDDGVVWSFAERPDDDPWQQLYDAGPEFALAPDGSVWTTEEALRRFFLGHSVDGSEWDSWEVPFTEGPDGRMTLLGISGEGDAWVTNGEYDGVIGRFDGSDWQTSSAPPGAWLWDVGQDGTLWARSEHEQRRMLRFDGTDWTEYDEADGVPQMGGHEMPADIEVAPDSSVWVNSIPRLIRETDDGSIDDTSGEGDVCGGVYNFDGTTWTHYLHGTCVYDMDISPDGTTWLRGGTFDLNADFDRSRSTSGPVELYVITPEAVAATE
jgi:hypothetical protein